MSEKTKILHQHLIKCGGTSLNNFLATKFPASRALDPASIPAWSDSIRYGTDVRGKQGSSIPEIMTKFCFGNYDCVYGHNPMFWAATDDFLTITVLRNPIDRVFSQIKDWQRLEAGDITRGRAEDNAFKHKVRDSDLIEAIKAWDSTRLGRNNLSNMQTRLLSLSLEGHRGNRDWASPDSLESAKKALSKYDLVGTTENLGLLMKSLCYRMHWCPPRELFNLNAVKKSSSNIPEEAYEIAKDINQNDDKLYDFAKKRENELEKHAEYDVDQFEEMFACDRVKVLSPVFLGGREFRFDFNMPIIGSGLWPRDAANTFECAVWTGPSKLATLFFPAMTNAAMKIAIGVKGYANESIRNGLKFYVDGERKNHSFISGDGLRDRIEIEHIPSRDFIRVDMQASETASSEEDYRARGVSLAWYGYTLSA